MSKLKVLGASLAMALLIASPAAADTTVQFGGASVEDAFLFFDDGVFNNTDGDFLDGFFD
jgi:hypothetical protein